MRLKHSMATALLPALLPALMLATTSGSGPVTGGSTAVLDRVVDATTAVVLIEEAGKEIHLPISALHPDASPGTWLHLWPPAGPMVDRSTTEQRRADLRARQQALLDRSDPRRWTRDADSVYSRPSLAASATAPARLRTPSLS